MHRPLTQQELKIIRAIRDYTRRNNVPPTYDEIAEAVGRTKSTIRHTLRRFVAKGLLEKRTGFIHRNLFITEAGLAAASNGRKSRRSK